MQPEPSAYILPSSSTTIVQAASLYVDAQLPPLALYGLRPDGTCMCSNPECPPKNRGKHPIGNRWQSSASLDPEVVRERFAGHAGNIGIYLGLTGLVLIDADGEEGLATVAEWDLPETLTQRSGRAEGGAHYIFQFAPHHDTKRVTDRRVAPGVDVKTHGQFVAAPSLHVSGRQYEWVVVRPPATLPDHGYERIAKRRLDPVSAVLPVAPPSAGSELYERARRYIDTIDPAISGAGGHNQTFAAARAAWGWVQKGLPESQAYGLLQGYNQRCQPPWTPTELAHKWESAKTATHVPIPADRPRLYAVPGGRVAPAAPAAPAPTPGPDDVGSSSPPPTPPPPPPGGGSGPPPPTREPDWRAELLWAPTRSGADKLVIHLDNVVRILQLDPRWKGRIRFDTFRSRIVVVDPPWDEYQRPSEDLVAWSDNDTSRLSAWLRRAFHRWTFNPSINDCERAVAVVARTRDFNPVRDYLSSLEWDGTPRIGTWLSTFLGAPQDEYTRLVGTWWLISAVARVFRPGCKVDTVPILEGEQGLRKSTALKVLAGEEFFNDTPIDIGHKDAYGAIQGCWFVELAELESLMRVEPSRSKAFFSSGKDRFRRAYARHEGEERRQCIFVGTVNLVEYLSDPTGGRRFWPIRCSRIDIDGLRETRDQLWAEALAEFNDGRTWYPETTEDAAIFTARQEERLVGDAWEHKLRAYLDSARSATTSVRELLQHALSLEPRDWTKAAQTRVGILMTSRLNWTKRRPTTGSGTREYVYERPE